MPPLANHNGRGIESDHGKMSGCEPEPAVVTAIIAIQEKMF